MKIATCNVNGIRAAARKGMFDWVQESAPDILLLQEVRAPEDIVFSLVEEQYQVVQQASQLKGRAGVAILVKNEYEIAESVLGLVPTEVPVDSGRWIEAYIPQLETRFISAYLHSGIATNVEKMAAKYAHLDLVTKRLAELKNQGNVLVAGDFNIVHTERDIKNWKSNHNKTSGVLDTEIAYLDKWFTELAYVDVQRRIDPDSQGLYTWWSQRGQAFDNDAGWRLDYQIANSQLAARAQSYRVDRAASYAERWSDHAPLVIEYVD